MLGKPQWMGFERLTRALYIHRTGFHTGTASMLLLRPLRNVLAFNLSACLNMNLSVDVGSLNAAYRAPESHIGSAGN